jgi:hypothetical protein
METNKIDNIVRSAIEKRTIQPSSSAWERMSDQLDAIEQPKRINWFKYAGYAAGILLLISVAFFINRKDDKQPDSPIINEIVNSPVDTKDLVKPNFNNVQEETVIVNKEEEKKDEKKELEKSTIVKKNSTELKVPSVVKESSRIVIADNTIEKKKVEGNKSTKSTIVIDSDALLKSVTNTETIIAKTDKVEIPKIADKLLKSSRITINSDALLYAVSNPDKDISEYYKKYDINRADVLNNIKNELKKFNLKVDAQTILADVEKTIDEETFKKSFMQVVKGKITGLASAFANRNN